MNRASPITPAPAVNARPRGGFQAEHTTAMIAGSRTTQTAPFAMPNGDPSKVCATPTDVATPTRAAPTSNRRADPMADRVPLSTELTRTTVATPSLDSRLPSLVVAILVQDRPHFSQPLQLRPWKDISRGNPWPALTENRTIRRRT